MIPVGIGPLLPRTPWSQPGTTMLAPTFKINGAWKPSYLRRRSGQQASDLR